MPNDAPIAVVGFAYRAPGVGGKGLLDYLAQAKSAWSKIPADRFDQDAYCRPGTEKSGVFRVEGGHFVPGDIYAFDAAFFNMRAEEAKNSDPQQRMLLEVALEAAEMAGHSLNSLSGQKIGVFIGSGQHDYSGCLTDDTFGIKTFTATGIAPCMLANRLSYFFDIDGPSTVLDSACASSAYAVHQAVLAIRNGDCNAAFAASASLNISPGGFLALEKTGALSNDGRSYSYDCKASGFGRGEGGACLLLKCLDDAISDGDPIQAVIRSSACNHGGRSDGITMPNGVAHRKLLQRVHEVAGLDPSETAVVEGHGTGTAVGDPIEAGAFTSVLAKNRAASDPIYIGSIKSNMGHLEGASGMIGMVKAILQVKHGIVLPTAGFDSINPKIQDKEKIVVPQVQIPWPQGEVRRILVTNFGFGGSNSAIIIDEPPSRTHTETNGYLSNGNGIHSNGNNGNKSGNNSNGIATTSKRVFAFSAKSEKSLISYLSSFDEYLREAPGTDEFMARLSYTLGQRRTHFPHRISVVASSTSSLIEKLSTSKPSRAKDRVVVFAFTGQGAQYPQMAARLQHYKAFSRAIAVAEAHFREFGAHWSLTEKLLKPDGTSLVNDAMISQPACTAIQLALVSLLRSSGVEPTLVTGHSSGEIAAAFTAGLLSFKTACAVSYFRGQAAAQLLATHSGKGAMIALGIDPEEATDLIRHHAGGAYAVVAAINSPRSVTISGDVTAIQNIQNAAGEKGLFCRRLKVELAYHSRHMEMVADYYLESIKLFCDEDLIDPPEAKTSYPVFVSSVTGQVEDTATIDATYWVKNLVRPVRFSDAIQTLFTSLGKDVTNRRSMDPNVIIEIGPHSALKNPIRQTIELAQLQKLGSQQTTPITYLPSLIRGTDGDEAFASLASSLFTLGSSINLGEVNGTSMGTADVLDDLPAYAWDKSTSYRIESRSNHERLFPGEPYNALIGRPMSSNGGNERAYRQVFTLDEMPWIRDHAVAGAVVFPMTAYIACAIEAARKTFTVPAAAFVVRDFYIKERMEIQEEQSIDMVTKLKPAATGAGSFSRTTWDFEISTWDDAKAWTVHAHGSVQPETNHMTADTMGLQASLPLVNTTGELIEHDLTNYYKEASVRATRFGPTFQNSVKFFSGKGYTVLEHRLRDLGSALDGLLDSVNSPVTVDPPTLDGFLQGGAPLQITEDGRLPAQMPNYISRFRVSNTIPSTPGQRFDIVTRLLHYDFKGGRMQIGVAAFSRDPQDALTPIAEWESVAFRTVGSAEENMDPAASLPDNWGWELLPSLEYLSDDQIKKVLPEHADDQAEETRAEDLKRMAWYYINKGLVETARDDCSKLPYHLAQFVKWGIRHDAANQVTLASDAAATELRNIVRNRDAQGEMLCVLGEQIVPILRQQVEPLEIMLSDGLLTRHYEADAMNAHFSKTMGRLVSHLSDLVHNMRILEVGAGTGGTTLPVLEALTRNRKEEGGVYVNYTFTDVSTGFFENAREKLARWSRHITFQKLDITQDPVEQGFELEDYDVVIAANVLHATPDMRVTMENVRKLLKPRGKLLLLEASAHPPTLLPFFLLPGWWYAEDRYRDREEGPMMPVPVWDRLLKDTGFSGVDINVRDQLGGQEQVMGIMCTTRIGKTEANHALTVCGPLMDEEELAFARTVADAVAKRFGCPTKMKAFAEIDPAEDPLYIVLDSPRQSLMKDIDALKFDRLKQLLVHNAGLLWVIPKNGPVESGTIKGIMRTLRLEDEPKNLLLLDQLPLTMQASSAILDLTEKLRDPEVTRTQDPDFVWHEGSIHVPRMRLLRELKEPFALEQGISRRKLQNIWDGERALEMTIDSAGSPDSIYYRRTDVLQDTLKDKEVLVRVTAAGVSQRDLSLILGTMPWTPPGYDGVGTIVKTGRAVTGLHVGDEAFFLSIEGSSGFATYKRLPSSHVVPVPPFICATDAATMPLAYTMAIFALIHTAHLEEGETYLGGQVYATAGTSDKREFLHSSYGIPRERIFSSRNPQFRDKILCATRGEGIDVIINSVTGDLMKETWSLVAPLGRFVEINNKDALQNTHLPMTPFERNATFHSIDLRSLAKHHPGELGRIISTFADLAQRRIAVPIKPVSIFPISELESGLRRLRSGENSGKVVVTFGRDERVMAESDLRATRVALNPEATYMITGGTKGIGLSLGYWMIEHGAMNLVLLGRSGASVTEVQKLLSKYERTNVCVRALACDVGSRTELEGVMESIKDLPRVRGVIHSALLLSDKLFENATYEDWQIIMRPRVDAAWHLHELLPQDMDFFIGLGSLLGDTGNPGQAIYAGSAVFYHEFAKYRRALGMHTVAIALPVVLDVGYVASNHLSDLLQQTLGATLTMADICTLVGGAVTASSPLHRDAKAIACTFYLDGQPIRDGPWDYIHPVYARERVKEEAAKKQRMMLKNGDGATRMDGLHSSTNGSNKPWQQAVDDPLPGLIEVLITKVAAMTMLDRDDVRADAPLASLSLDSLVSVELRNWIRREAGVELVLSAITGAESLRALAMEILVQRK
ncbi:polyketide synthase [Apiospora rasikravindrae]|uniref:Polyketide synthase n=1 Tax=Apiospora rasikravindrae TaxID=990691 RepID=A0ABR1TYW0_9PEZI